jgi:predicted AlkP superfamily phosphohydrolase/phosphomutase
MSNRVIAIGLDSTDLEFIERYSSKGELPNFTRLQKKSTVTKLVTDSKFVDGMAPFAGTEGNWVMFQTGVRHARSGFWDTVCYDPETYRTTNDFTHSGYDFREYSPFHALTGDSRVATFDVPVSKVVPDIKGKQIVGWGGHFPYVVRGSSPPELLSEIDKRFGKNKVIYRDHGVFWSRRYRKWLEESVIDSTVKREKIILDLLNDDTIDLMVAVVGETHSALHDLWAQSDPVHPVHHDEGRVDPLLKIFKSIDKTIGAIASRLSADDHFILFSVHGMQANSTDLPCLFFLSELMYRFNFPGKFGIAKGNPDAPVPPPVRFGLHWYWFGEIWRKKHCSWEWLNPVLRRLPSWYRWKIPGGDLRFPFFTSLKGAENGWMPATWYRPSWPKSRSFALPSFADGHVRINLMGREKHGVVPVHEYNDECKRVTRFLKKSVNPRTGEPIVKKIFRTRKDPLVPAERLSDADLIVVWTDKPFDVVDSPEVGRIGPVPYFRTGGHRAGGFALLSGPKFKAGTSLGQREIIDLPATILDLINVPIPDYFEGKSFLTSMSSTDNGETASHS